jgi:hypothetical protein
VAELRDRTRRRPLRATGDRAEGRHYVRGLGAMEDRAKGHRCAGGPITEGAEQWTRVTLSLVGYANNYKC